jgi:hypothetical protein
VARPALVAIGLLLILGCAAAGAMLAGRGNENSAYLIAAQAIPPGGRVSAQDLQTVELDVPPALAAVPASAEASVVGDQANYEIPAGSLLDPVALSSGPAVLAGEAIVGTSLASNQLPDELAPGDEVLVIFTSSAGTPITATPPPTATSPTTTTPASDSHSGGPGGSVDDAQGGSQPNAGSVLAEAEVLDVVPPGSASATSAASGDLDTVSLAVPEADAALVTAASAANEVSLALVPPTPPVRKAAR